MALFGRPSQGDDTRELAYRQWFARQHPLALPSLLLSAFSVTHFGTLWVDEIAGITLGVVALLGLARSRKDVSGNARVEGDWLAWLGIAVGTISLIVAIVVYFVLPHR
jgi:hypothetical protein